MPLLINSFRFAAGVTPPAGPTRFYFESTGTPAVSPAFDATWGQTTSATRRPISVNKQLYSALTEKTTPAETSTSVIDVLNTQFISEPLNGAQTITGTVKGIIKTLEGGTLGTAGDARAQVVIYVVSNDGSTVRGTLLAADAGALASEFTGTITARKYPLAWSGAGATLSSVAAQDGDRIVVEVGARHHNVSATASTHRHEFGSAAASALAENETDTAGDAVSWIEFSQGLAFTGQSMEITTQDTQSHAAPSTAPTNPTTVPFGAVAAGWLGIMFAFAKVETTTRTVPSGFTQLSASTGGTGAAGADTGPLAAWVDYKSLAGSESGNISYAWGTAPSAAALVFVKWARYDGGTWSLASTTADDTTTGTGALAISGTGATDPGFQAGDLIVVGYGTPTDAAGLTVPAITVPGCTLSAVRRVAAGANSGGTDAGSYVYEATVLTGTSSGAPTFTASTSAANAGAGPMTFVRIR